MVRVVTPGTVVEPSLLDQKANNYLAALTVDGASAGLSYVDVSTGEFFTTQLPAEAVGPELDPPRTGGADNARGPGTASWGR